MIRSLVVGLITLSCACSVPAIAADPEGFDFRRSDTQGPLSAGDSASRPERREETAGRERRPRRESTSTVEIRIRRRSAELWDTTRWASPPGAGLYVSTVLRPAEHALPLLTIAAGVAMAEGIQSATGLVPDVKWPNDVFVGGRKAAGVLAEATSSAAGTYVALGFGINVSPAAYPPDVAARATNLEGELGRAVDRGLLLAECLCSLAARYQDLARGRSDAVVEAWLGRAASTLGRRVQWNAAGAALEGVAENIDAAGALVVRTRTGLARITAGEVRWV